MKRSIKTYLDYSGELYENTVPLSSAMSDENATESDREKLKQLVDLAQQNDANFLNFINNNTILMIINSLQRKFMITFQRLRHFQ